MPDAFVPLASLLRGAPAAAERAVVQSSAPAKADLQPGSAAIAGTDVIGELALMRLAALEAYERAAHRMLQRLAGDVLGRELLLAPIDVDALLARALASLSEAAPVALALSAADAQRVRSPLPTRIDPQLTAGDLIIEVRDGSIESHLVFRLAAALERAEHAA